ncbi:MAG: DUF6494 family protein [Gammaproteobacteria bacterium]
MNEDDFNMEMRKFLKKVGITSQREITHAVETAISTGKLTGSEVISAKVVLQVPELDLNVEIDGDIALE